MDNLMTAVQDQITEIYKLVDAQLKEYGGKMPYGMRKATPKEQRERFENLTPGELYNMTQTYGEDEVNKWLSKHMKEG